MEVNYTEKGEKGKTCSDCKHFEPDNIDPDIGKCFGHDVKAEAGCNYFEPKNN